MPYLCFFIYIAEEKLKLETEYVSSSTQSFVLLSVSLPEFRGTCSTTQEKSYFKTLIFITKKPGEPSGP